MFGNGKDFHCSIGKQSWRIGKGKKVKKVSRAVHRKPTKITVNPHVFQMENKTKFVFLAWRIFQFEHQLHFPILFYGKMENSPFAEQAKSVSFLQNSTFLQL